MKLAILVAMKWRSKWSFHTKSMAVRGSIGVLVLIDARASFCSDEPDVRAHMYLFRIIRDCPCHICHVYIYIHIYVFIDIYGHPPPRTLILFAYKACQLQILSSTKAVWTKTTITQPKPKIEQNQKRTQPKNNEHWIVSWYTVMYTCIVLKL